MAPVTADPGLGVEDVSVRFGDREVLDEVGLHVPPGEVVCLLGPSGSGKSTLLQVVAGLREPDAGRVTWDGADLAGVPSHRRRFGLVFQDPLLFPHLDVGGNIGYGLRIAGGPRPEVTARVDELLGLVELPGYARRSVARCPVERLSGWPSRGHWPRGPGCCSSTSPSGRSTASCGTGWRSTYAPCCTGSVRPRST